MPKKDYYFGDILPKFYDDLVNDRYSDDYLPRADLAYITSLLTEKFGRRFSFREVARLLKEEQIA